MKRPQALSKEWFDRWFNEEDRTGFRIRRSEDELRTTLLEAKSDREKISEEIGSHRKTVLRVEKLNKMWYEANCRAVQARQELIILLRMQGRHEEADAEMSPKNQRTDRSRAAAARAARELPTGRIERT
jgi:hypothetical protein